MALTRKKPVATAPPPKRTIQKVPPGKVDPHMSGCVLIDLDKAPDHFPKIYAASCPPETFFRFEKATKKVTTLVTVTPDGTHLAWWICRSCSGTLEVCQCARGVTAPRSIEYIYDQTVAKMAGEDWTIHHPNYNGSITKVLNKSRRSAPSLPPVPSKPKRTLSRKVEKPVEKMEPFDLKKTDAAAEDMAASLTRKLVRKTEAKPVPKKRTLTRRKS